MRVVSLADDLVARHRSRFDGFPEPLFEAYAESLRALEPRLTPTQLEAWSQGGLDLMAISLRSWESAAEYFKAGPLLDESTPWDAYEQLAREASELTEQSAPLAVSFLRSAPATLSRIGPNHLGQWADFGRRLYKGNWKSSSLAAQFYDAGPDLFGAIRVSHAGRLALFLDELARHSYELAAACLAAAPEVLGRLDNADRMPFLAFGVELAQTSWADSRLYFDRGAPLIQRVHGPVRERYLTLAAQVARDHNRSVFQYFEDAAHALGEVEPDEHGAVIQLAEQLAPHSPYAAMDFISNAPAVLEKVRIDELAAWQNAGLGILASSRDGGEAFFRLQSSRGEEILDTLSARVELPRVGDILRLYAKALTGRNISIHASAVLTEKGIGWVDEERASTEGSTIYLPEVMERYRDKDENFAALKVFATHQAAHLEFDSFAFGFERPATLFEDLRPTIPEAAGASPATEIERFFDLFPDRALASDIHEIAEDARIDAAIKRNYAGIRRALGRMQREELGRRPEVSELPLRQAFVENLVRVSLDGLDAVRWPAAQQDAMSRGVAVLQRLTAAGATAEDAAEATLRLYQLAMGLRNEREEGDEEWDSLPDDPGAEQVQLDMSDLGGEGASLEMGAPEEGEAEYESPQEIDFRGDFKPELVQLLMKLRDDARLGEAGQVSPEQLTEEQLQELLEKSAEIDLDTLLEGDLQNSTGLFLSNLLKEAGTPTLESDAQGDQPLSDLSTGAEEGEEPLAPVVTTYYYDEWDFRAQDYKPRWCAVKEATLEEGGEEFYDETLKEYAALVAQTRKQFELMKPELFRKIKKLSDGEDVELDPAIEWMIDLRTGVSPSDKIYWRRNKVERDVAIAFLLDMSASTDEEIARRDQQYDDSDDDPRKYLSWWVTKRRQEMAAPPKRIIDLEKEATVLLITALETIGDDYGIYGFSGYGRDNVEFYVIKDFDEQFGEATKKRIDKVTPIRSTRMGPAIRHAITKLGETDAKVRILVLLSDGRPQDHGYGRDRTEKEYAIHDTRQALNEAKREGVTPFALTVDRAGHDYLKTMCEDMGYEVVGDIESLPRRLPALYRRLTE